MKPKDRLDKILTDQGLVKSRERARALIMEGKVSVGGTVVSKSGTLVSPDSAITVRDDMPYVGRGGLKLEAALDHFGIDPNGKTIMDVGCSTGGFTDCVLKRSARRVYAIDVGHGQFDWSLRHDPRVVLLEKTNIRYLGKESVAEPIDLAIIDVSFISLILVLPRMFEFLGEDGEVLALIKPQFEAGKGMVGKGGIVRNEYVRDAIVENIRNAASEMGFTPVGLFESPVKGQKGNREYFLYLRRG